MKLTSGQKAFSEALAGALPVIDERGAACVVTNVVPHSDAVYIASRDGQAPHERILDWREFVPMFDGTGRFKVPPRETKPAAKKRARRKP